MVLAMAAPPTEGGAVVTISSAAMEESVKPSTSPELGEETAVWVRGAYKSYGRGKHAQHVLKNLDMNVPRGAIYGLLGASGCGKTTLLSCVAGLRHLDKGTAKVFGQRPSPGPALGFMPQEIGLMGDFTIRDTFFYFGRIFGLSSKEIEGRIEAMNRLLDLPPHTSYVANLSGGQKRRVSLAATLVHDPELLILDEPTVGLDPILRHRIWEHLSQVTRLENRTVIISTHYIEEARHSDVVGLMRGGALLAEAAPNSLMARFNSNSLEQVFLHLSASQHARNLRRHEAAAAGGGQGEEEEGEEEDPELTVQIATADTTQVEDGVAVPVDTTSPSSGLVLRHPRPSWSDSWQDLEIALKEPWGGGAGSGNNTQEVNSENNKEQSMKPTKRTKRHKRRRVRCWGITEALLKKNVIRYVRNPGLMLFCFFIAMAQISFFFLTIGREPYYLPMAVISEEVPLDPTGTCDIVPGCTEERLSCRFLREISTDLIRLVPFDNEGVAQAELKAGHVRGLIQLGSNFSAAIAARNETGRHTSDETLEMGEVGVTLDMTDVAFGILISEELKNAFGRFFSELLTQCGTNPKYGKLPILFEKPVFGTPKDTYATFMAPGASLCVVTFLGMTVACMPMIIEMMDGVWDRAIVSGVPPSAVMWSHVVVQSIVVFIQHVQVILVAMLGFEVQNEGSVFLFAGITLLEGICGMALGMFISVLTNDIMSATWFTMGSFVPLVMLCGMMWPVQGMPVFLQYISSAIPLSSGTVALRSVLRKGADIHHPEVVKGLAMGAGWTVALLISCCLLLVYRQSRK